MGHLNVEVKARCRRPDDVRRILRGQGAELGGTDRQVDTYFRCACGRLKLREGSIERSLIHYLRPDQAGPKEASVTLWRTPEGPGLKEVLAAALGVQVIVSKDREIYFIGNVKFHIDRVDELGEFVEIEAIDADWAIGPVRLMEQCRRHMAALGIDPADLVVGSYSDMILAAREGRRES